jgi:hypothetical protein
MITEVAEIELLPPPIPGAMSLDGLNSVARGKMNALLIEAENVLSLSPSTRRLASEILLMRARRVEPDEVRDFLDRSMKYLVAPLALPSVGAAVDDYVDCAHIAQLRTLQLAKPIFDLSKLIRLCEELNAAHRSGSTMTVAMLIRAIKDHCPPVFGARNFAEAANQASGISTSKKKQLLRLETSLKHVADAYLHEQIRHKEPLPVPTEVEFRSELATLLGEIISATK